MSLQKQSLALRLAPVRDELALEFPSLSRSEVDATVAVVEQQLRASARILDYVPVLALRLARDRLRAREVEAAARAA
jgi:Protein-tyrosine-phosphatase-like, N-terminal domain